MEWWLCRGNSVAPDAAGDRGTIPRQVDLLGSKSRGERRGSGVWNRYILGGNGRGAKVFVLS